MCAKLKKLPIPEIPDLNSQIEFLYNIRSTISKNNSFPITAINIDILDAIIQTMISHKINLYTEQLDANRKAKPLISKSLITNPDSKTVL